MHKLFAAAHNRKIITDRDVERLLSHHPYIGMLLCGIVVPILILAAVGIACCAVMLPVSLMMGWV